MKRKVKLVIGTIVFVLCLCSKFVNAQWQNPPLSGVPSSMFANTWATGPATKWTRSVGIGDFAGNFAYPNSFLHVNSNYLLIPSNGTITSFGEVFRTTSNAPVGGFNAWRMFTGAGNGTEKFSIYTFPTSNFMLNTVVLQASQPGTLGQPSNICFNAGGNLERMRIVGTDNPNFFPSNPITTYPVRAGNVGIGAQAPCAMLQIGGDVTTNGGYRDWMYHGAYVHQGSDNMYFGFRYNVSPESNAIINWGNDPGSGSGPDRLLFVFTSVCSGLGFQSHNSLGLEGSRMVTNGNRFFIGFGGDPNNPNQNPYSNNPDPGNTVEINSDQMNIGPANSGLRFTDLNSTATPLSNPGLGVLTVNGNGDVIYVTGGIGSVTAQNALSHVGSNTIEFGLNPFIHDTDVPMNNFNLSFSDPAIATVAKNRIRFGNSSQSTSSKFTFDNSNDVTTLAVRSWAPESRELISAYCPVGITVSTPIEVYNGISSLISGGVNTTNISNYAGMLNHAINGVVRNDYNANNIGGNFLSTTNSSSFINRISNIGVYAHAENAYNTFGGVFSSTTFIPAAGQSQSYGVSADAYGGNISIGVRSGAAHGNITYGIVASALYGQTNYGIYANADGGNIDYAIFGDVSGSSPANYAGYFNGPLYASSYLNLPSDIRIKTNIQPVDNSLDLIDQLKPKTFYFDTVNFSVLNLPKGKQYGLIAQDVEPLLPNSVKTIIQPAKYDSLGNVIQDSVHFKSLNYEAFIPILIQGIKDLKQTNSTKDSLILSMYERLNALESLVNTCCQNSQTKTVVDPTFSKNVELNNAKAIVLNQNMPNPFSENTVITFQIPETVNNAQIMFADNNGNIIKTVEISERGFGELKVYAANLSSGSYVYYLVCDGKTIDTKRMVCTK